MFFEKILSYIYPKYCVFCEKKINSNSYTCEKCLSILKCNQERIITNANCYYEYMMNLFIYDGIVKKLICELKFNEKKYIGRVFASIILEKIKDIKIDIIIPVPISKERYKERGYNQCEEITKYVSKHTNKRSLKNVLIKTRNNKRQSGLHIEERKQNVLGVYKVNHTEKIKGKTILLIDDVCTTGATINECAKILKLSGAKKVIVVTIAYAKKEI